MLVCGCSFTSLLQPVSPENRLCAYLRLRNDSRQETLERKSWQELLSPKTFVVQCLNYLKGKLRLWIETFFSPPVLEKKVPAAAAEEEEAVKGVCHRFVFSQPSHKLGIWTNWIALSISLTAVLSLLLKQMCHNNHPICTEGVFVCLLVWFKMKKILIGQDGTKGEKMGKEEWSRG